MPATTPAAATATTATDGATGRVTDGVADTVADDAVALRARDVTVKFGGLTALSAVSLAVPNGSVVGLIGPNGAGKSTLLGVLSGFLRPTSGAVEFGGSDVSQLPAHARARAGLVRTFQQPELFAEMTVRDHLVLSFRAARRRRRLLTDLYSGRGLLTPATDETARVDELLALLGIQSLAGAKVLSLPLGASRLVEVGRALAMSPRVLLLDEPSAGLDRGETERLTESLRRVVADEQVSLLLVEHDVEMVLGLSQHVYVLDFGRMIADGTPAETRANPVVRTAYLGEPLDADADADADAVADTDADPDPDPDPDTEADAEVAPAEFVAATSRAAAGEARPLLRVEQLSVAYGRAQALDRISLTVGAGSAVAVLGVNGAGKSTLSRALSGLVASTHGSITFAGTDITTMAPHRIRQLGLAYLPEGRGIFPGLTVLDNLRMAVQSLSRGERADAIARAIEMFPVLGERARQLAGNLSGGEQQMLSLARGLAVSPTLVIADELSLGLAPKVIDRVFEGLDRARRAGVSVIVIEQFVQRALAFCDYAYILRRGVLCWQGDAAAAADGAAEHYLGAEDVLAG